MGKCKNITSCCNSCVTTTTHICRPITQICYNLAKKCNKKLFSISEAKANLDGALWPQTDQNEPALAVNPTDACNIVSGANDLLTLSPCFVNPVTQQFTCQISFTEPFNSIYTTLDGGRTWYDQVVNFSLTGTRSRSDPVSAFGPKPNGAGGFSFDDGARAYFNCLATDFGDATDLTSNVSLVYSDDKGLSWNTSNPTVVAPAVVIIDPVTGNIIISSQDKNWVYADKNPDSPNFGNVYVSWSQFIDVFDPDFNQIANSLNIQAARSTDGGVTFSAPVDVSVLNFFFPWFDQDSHITTTPNGDVFIVWQRYFPLPPTEPNVFPSGREIWGARSTDGGLTYGPEFRIAQGGIITGTLDCTGIIGAFLPGAKFQNNIGLDVDSNDSGEVLVAWMDFDEPNNGHSIVKLSKSSDLGATWQTFIVVNLPDRLPFFPNIAIQGNNVYIGYLGLTRVPVGTPIGGGVVSYDAFFTLSQDRGTTFTKSFRLSSKSSDPAATFRGSRIQQFLGDYTSSDIGPDGKYWMAWTDARYGATCEVMDAFIRCEIPQLPNFYAECPINYGNSDIFVASVEPLRRYYKAFPLQPVPNTIAGLPSINRTASKQLEINKTGKTLKISDLPEDKQKAIKNAIKNGITSSKFKKAFTSKGPCDGCYA